MRIEKPGALFLWAFVCLTAFFVVQTALHACSRTVYAFSRDKGLPDGGFFSVMNDHTGTPIRAIWVTTLAAILPGLLDFASPVAANAVFSLTAMALDLSYIIPIFLRRVYEKHPDVRFSPGPFYMGDGWMGLFCNVTCIAWTLFVSVLFALPTYFPVTAENMNYASVITVGVIALSLLWYFSGARRHYTGPVSYTDGHGESTRGSTEDKTSKKDVE